MKKIVKFALLAALCAGAASCVKPITEDAFSKDPVAPELYAHNDILMTANTMDEDVNFSWSAYRNLPEDLSYQLVATYNGTDAVIATTKDTWFKTSKTAFKGLIYTSFPNAPVNDTFSLTFRVVVANDGDLYESPALTINVYALGDAVAPVVTLVQKELKLDPATPTAEVALITWEPARLVYGEEISYNVYLTTATEKTPSTKAEAVSDYLLAEGISGTSYAMTVDALNEAVIAAGGAEAAAVPVTFRVKALCASLPEGITASSDPMTVTTYVATFPDVLYTPGSHQGWDPATAATLKQSTSVKGYYEGIIDLTTADGSDAQFKFSPNPEWKDDFGGTVTVGGKDGVYVSAEGTVGVADNISVPSGVYVIMLNKKLNTLKMVSIKSLGMIGTAAGGWSEELPMEWNKETNVFTVTADIVPGEYKFRLNNDWDFSVDNTGGVNGGGANYQTDAEGRYKVSIDMGSHPYTVK
ncbi:MAG: SusE domain-containing protein, partial [Bacteroidales bacterium]|nr:SusE domain-containing protein [Bacteroidales bacterium]